MTEPDTSAEEATSEDARRRLGAVAREAATWAFLALLSLVIFGYAYPHGNHGQGVPPIMRLLDPSLFVRDASTMSFDAMGPRFFFDHLVALLSLGRIDLIPHGHLVLYVATVVLYVGATRKTAAIVFGDARWGVVLFAGLVVVNAARGVGMNLYYWTSLVPSFVAGGLALWGYRFALEERPMAAYAMFGLGSLFQIIVGSVGGALVTPFLLLRCWEGRRSDLLRGLALWVALTAVVAAPTLLGGHEPSPHAYDIIETWAWIRNPHHYVPSTWPVAAWYELAGVVVFVLAGAWALRRTYPSLAGVAFSVTLGTLAALIVNHLAVEVVPMTFVAKLQLGRSVPFLQLMMVLVATATVVQGWGQSRWLQVLLALAALPMARGGIFLAPVGLALAVGSSTPWRRALSVLLLASALVYFTDPLTSGALTGKAAPFFVFVGVALLVLRTDTLDGYRADWLPQAVMAVMVAGALLYKPEHLGGAVQLEQYPKSDLLDVARAMRKKTRRDALFLAPVAGTMTPEVYFSMLSHRAVVVSYKNAPFTDAGMQEWRFRLETVLGQPLTRTDHNVRRMWREASFDHLRDAARTFDADYLVIEKARVPPEIRKTTFYANRTYVVVRVQGPEP